MARLETRLNKLEKDAAPDKGNYYGFLFCQSDNRSECPGCPACDKARAIEEFEPGEGIHVFVVRCVKK